MNSYSTSIILILFAFFLKYSLMSGRFIGHCETHSSDKLLTHFINLSKVVEPCDNFYAFTCGSYHSSRSKMELKIEQDIKMLLYFDTENKNRYGDSHKKLQVFYRSCLNLPNNKRDRWTLLSKYFDPFGGLPVLRADWSPKRFDLMGVLGIMARFEINPFFSVSVSHYPWNVNMSVIRVQPEIVTLMLSTESNFVLVKKDNERIERIIKSNLYWMGIENPEDMAEKIISFEREASRFSFIQETDKPPAIREITYRKLKDTFPEFDWDKFVRTYTGTIFMDSQIVIVYEEKHLSKILNLIKSTDSTVLGHYLAMRLIENDYDSCYKDLKKYLPEAVSAFYIENHLNQDTRKYVSEMISVMKDSFIEIISESRWLDENTKNSAIEKIQNLRVIVGYHPEITSAEDIDNEYKDLDLSQDDYYQNRINIYNFRLKKILKSLEDSFSYREEFDTLKILANYEYESNRVRVLAGLIQPPFYDSHRMSKAFLWGGFGTYIAHEIAHPLDPFCRHFDSKGNLQNWWSNESSNIYDEKIKCFVEQFDNLTRKDNIVGIGYRARNENIATSLGLEISFRSYQKWLTQQSEDEVIEKEKIPGLNYSPSQLFFIGFSHFYCDEGDQDPLRSVYANDEEYVNGPIHNSEHFSKLFGCLKGSPMNPENKCNLFS